MLQFSKFAIKCRKKVIFTNLFTKLTKNITVLKFSKNSINSDNFID